MEPLTPVSPTRPIAPWLGGKRNLAKRICALIDTIPHETYAEGFVGMGGVFLRRSSRPRSEFMDLARPSNWMRSRACERALRVPISSQATRARRWSDMVQET